MPVNLKEGFSSMLPPWLESGGFLGLIGSFALVKKSIADGLTIEEG